MFTSEFDSQLKQWGFSARSRNVIWKLDIGNPEELCQRSMDDLLEVPGCGIATVQHIRERLEHVGLTLRCDPPLQLYGIVLRCTPRETLLIRMALQYVISNYAELDEALHLDNELNQDRWTFAGQVIDNPPTEGEFQNLLERLA